MDSLLHLSNVACEAERLSEGTPSCDSSSCSSDSTQSAQSSPKDLPIPPPRCTTSPTNAIKKKLPCEQILTNDRTAIQDKIRTAYTKKASDYDSLLNLCVAVTEDRIYHEAPSKLDYYKQGIALVKTVFDKSAELRSSSNNLEALETAAKPVEASSSEEAPRALKRAKTQH
eukprot:gene27290-32962_t